MIVELDFDLSDTTRNEPEHDGDEGQRDECNGDGIHLRTVVVVEVDPRVRGSFERHLRPTLRLLHENAARAKQNFRTLESQNPSSMAVESSDMLSTYKIAVCGTVPH